MRKFMIAQKKKIEIDKWCTGNNIHADPGKSYILEWIRTNGQWFRQAWEKSLCRECALAEVCGYEVVENCKNFNKTF